MDDPNGPALADPAALWIEGGDGTTHKVFNVFKTDPETYHLVCGGEREYMLVTPLYEEPSHGRCGEGTPEGCWRSLKGGDA